MYLFQCGRPVDAIKASESGVCAMNGLARSVLRASREGKESIMDTLLIIVVLVLLFGGGGFYWRSRRG
jgi:hypothetical protein